jgi:small subunit ribosomal protein S6
MLPKPITKFQVQHRQGHYFIMRFDSSARIQHDIRRTLSLDPRVLRSSFVKMGDNLEDIKNVSGRAEWPNEHNEAISKLE